MASAGIIAPSSLAGTLALALVCAANPAVAETLTLRRAVLTLGGVGTFEYSATADASGVVTLPVRRVDMDDVLKSLAVLQGGDRVLGIDMPGPSGVEAAFATLPIAPDALGSTQRLLERLRGVPVEVRDVSGREIIASGRVLGVERTSERVVEPGGGTASGEVRPQTVLSLLTDQGLRRVVLEESGPIAIVDPTLRAGLEAGLEALRNRPADERRDLRLRLSGTGSQPVRIAVVTQAPLWKASYRVLLSPPQGGRQATTARLQGWAVVENTSASDWSDVALSLQTGNPVAFRMPLYEIAQVVRPELPIDQLTHPQAVLDQRATEALAEPPPPPLPAPAAAAPRGLASRALSDFAAVPKVAVAATSQTLAASRYDIQTLVSLAAGRTASIPFLDTEVAAEPLDLLTFEAPHPLAAVRLTNATGSALTPGPVAAYDASGFLGDARLAGLPAGERRLITFAEDAAVTATWDHDDNRDVVGLTAAGGVAQIIRRQRAVVRITLGGAADAERSVVIELPRDPNSHLDIEGASLVEQTDGSWRLGLTLPRGGRVNVKATMDRRESEAVEIGSETDSVLALSGLGSLKPAERAALQHIATLRRDLAARTAERDRLGERITEITNDEGRLRSNITAAPPGDALHNRMLRQLDAAETSLAQAEDARAAARAAVDAAQHALDEAIATLTVGQ